MKLTRRQFLTAAAALAAAGGSAGFFCRAVPVSPLFDGDTPEKGALLQNFIDNEKNVAYVECRVGAYNGSSPAEPVLLTPYQQKLVFASLRRYAYGDIVPQERKYLALNELGRFTECAVLDFCYRTDAAFQKEPSFAIARADKKVARLFFFSQGYWLQEETAALLAGKAEEQALRNEGRVRDFFLYGTGQFEMPRREIDSLYKKLAAWYGDAFSPEELMARTMQALQTQRAGEADWASGTVSFLDRAYLSRFDGWEEVSRRPGVRCIWQAADPITYYVTFLSEDGAVLLHGPLEPGMPQYGGYPTNDERAYH